MENYLTDFAALSFSTLLLMAYQAYVNRRSRADPHYSIQQVISAARLAWVETVMRERRYLLAVQTLRNSIMAASFLASTAVLLIIGVLTLSEQGDKVSGVWHALNSFGHVPPQLWLIKLLILLLDLLVAFFSFALAIRLFHHVSYLLNVPIGSSEFAEPRFAAAQLNRAGRFYSIGTRAYYLLVPQLFWLFGPHFLVIATVLLIWVLYHLDRSPPVDTELIGE